jgi:antibiotic biosynthesis monooxygenase (ABM) superfamily enzyme
MWLKHLKKLIQFDNIINIIFWIWIFADFSILFAHYVLKKEVPTLQIIESVCYMIFSSIFVLALVVTLMSSWKERKERKEQLDAQFGLGGTFVRITLGIAIIFGVIFGVGYFIARFLLPPV